MVGYGTTKSCRVWVATSGISCSCDAVEKSFVLRTIPDVCAIAQCTRINRTMAFDFEVGDDFFSFDFHHSRILRTARFRRIGSGIFRSSAAPFVFANFSDDFIFRRCNMFFDVGWIHTRLLKKGARLWSARTPARVTKPTDGCAQGAQPSTLSPLS